MCLFSVYLEQSLHFLFPIRRQLVPRVVPRVVGDVNPAEAAVLGLAEMLGHVGCWDLVGQGGDAVGLQVLGPGGRDKAVPSLVPFEEAGDIGGGAGEIFLVTEGAGIGDDERELVRLADVLVERGQLLKLLCPAGLLVEEDALNAGIEADPLIDVGLYIFRFPLAIAGADIGSA